MDTRGQAGRKIIPVVGGVTAAATAIGAWAPAVQLASAQPDGASAAVGATGALGAGTFEACSAYFGWGKDAGVLEVVEFDVADQNGDDGVDHAVPDDVQVVLVLETEEGGTIECTPEEVTEDQWNDEYDEDPNLPAWPGPGHYAYPSVNLQDQIEEPPAYGDVTAVGFRVTGIPGEHTLVSPQDVKPLVQHFLDVEQMFQDGEIDPRVLALIEAEAGAAAADAYEAYTEDCQDSNPDGTGEELIAAIQALNVLVDGEEDPNLTEADCFFDVILAVDASLTLAAYETVEYVEPIVLSVPETAPAAEPAPVAPQFTG